MATIHFQEKWQDAMKLPITLLEKPKTAYADNKQLLGFSGEGTTATFNVTGELIYDYRLEGLEVVARKVKTLEENIKKIANRIENLTCSYEAKNIEIRKIPYRQAKKEIVEFFKSHHGEKLNASDIQENLGIDITMAITACDELEKEGKIKQA